MQKLLTEDGIWRIYIIFIFMVSLILNVVFYKSADTFDIFVNNFYSHYVGLSTYMAFFIASREYKEYLDKGFFYKTWLMMQLILPAMALLNVVFMHRISDINLSLTLMYVLHGLSVFMALTAPLAIYIASGGRKPKEEKPADKPAAEAPKI